MERSAEKTNRPKKSRRKQLKMYMVELDDSPQAHVIRRLSDHIREICDEIQGEPEQVLAIGVSAKSLILTRGPVPAGKLKACVCVLEYDGALDQVAVDWQEILEKLLRRGLNCHGVR